MSALEAIRLPDAAPDRASLDGIGLAFHEVMTGLLTPGETNTSRGGDRGSAGATTCRIEVDVGIQNLGRFLRVAQHDAELRGTVTFAPLGGELSIQRGRFNLFTIDASGMRQMIYDATFVGADGITYHLHGEKHIQDDPGFDILDDMTRLRTTIHQGESAEGPVVAAGELRFDLKDAPALARSMHVTGATSRWQGVAARVAFLSFACGVLCQEYLKNTLATYETSYDNLVLAGAVHKGVVELPFFFASGVHDRGFPWGDGELFWDVLLVIGDPRAGARRFCITDRVLAGLELDLVSGTYRYHGPIFELREGPTAAFSQMRRSDAALDVRQARIEIAFTTAAFDTVSFPFPMVPSLVRKLSSRLRAQLEQILPGEHPLGIHITPHTVTIRSATIEIDSECWQVNPTRSRGEAEHGEFRNLKEPTLLYGYLCAIDPQQQTARVQIHARTLRDERERWAKDQLDAFLGTVVSRVAAAEMQLANGQLRVQPLPPAGKPAEQAIPLRKVGAPVLEVNNDHYPTAVFQRRIVEVVDESGGHCLALEEDMTRIRLEPVGTPRTATVASLTGPTAQAAIDAVLAATSFDTLLEERLRASTKPRERFSIVIKPNFMFAYDRRDHSTYTDPALVHHLIAHLRDRGFTAIKVVEAQSTYGEFFDQRSVREVADYLGYRGDDYEIVDMTEDATETRYLGPHLGHHPVSAAWRDADFRISFAKNKTHAFAFYTLTLKNIYGALPLANKFKEYHCARDIYLTTMEYLAAFPVHFGLIDAWLSADGPFGIFADPRPNETRTILGGPDLVAVDWVAATRMGIDPMISQFMREAVTTFGKPKIELVGDGNPYRPWTNVPVALALFAHEGFDDHYRFGNLIFSVCAQMDKTHFHYKNRSSLIRALRFLTVPLRRTFFVRTGENPTYLNRLASWLIYRLGF